MRYCSECGSIVEDNVQVCPSCGCQIKDEGLNDGMYMNSYSTIPEKKKTNKTLVIVLPILIIALLVGGLAAYKFVYIPKAEAKMEEEFKDACRNAKEEMIDVVNASILYRKGEEDLMSRAEAEEIKERVDGYYEQMKEHPDSYDEEYDQMLKLYNAYEDIMYALYDYDGDWWSQMDRLIYATLDFKEYGSSLGIENVS